MHGCEKAHSRESPERSAQVSSAAGRGERESEQAACCRARRAWGQMRSKRTGPAVDVMKDSHLIRSDRRRRLQGRCCTRCKGLLGEQCKGVLGAGRRSLLSTLPCPQSSFSSPNTPQSSSPTTLLPAVFSSPPSLPLSSPSADSFRSAFTSSVRAHAHQHNVSNTMSAP